MDAAVLGQTTINSGSFLRILRSDTFSYGLAVAAERFVSFFLLPVLTKSVSPPEYFIWTQSVVVAGVLTPIVLMGFQTALVKFLPRWNTTPRVRDSVVLAMLVGILLSMLIVSASFASLGSTVGHLIYGEAYNGHYLLLLAGLMVSEALFEFLVAILRATGRIRLIALYLLLKGLWRIGILLIVLRGTGGRFDDAMLVFVLVQGLIVGLMFFKEISPLQIMQSGLSSGRNEWGEVLSFSLPLVLLAAMTGLHNFTDRFFLAHAHSPNDVAAYAAATSLTAMASFFYSVLGFTLFPVLAGYWAQRRLDDAATVVRRVMQTYMILLLPFIAVMAASGASILTLLTTPAYAAPPMVFLLLACSVGLFGVYQIAFYVTLLINGSIRSLGLMGFAAALNIFLNAVLVPSLGMTGAALAAFASNALLAGGSLYMAHRVLDWHFPWAVSIRIAIRSIIVFGFITAAGYWIEAGNPLELISILSLAALLYFALDYLDRRNSLLTLLKST